MIFKRFGCGSGDVVGVRLQYAYVCICMHMSEHGDDERIHYSQTLSNEHLKYIYSAYEGGSTYHWSFECFPNSGNQNRVK